jgi:DNA-binding MarR family transcriptional regulator
MKTANGGKQSSASSLHHLTFVLQQLADEVLMKEAKIGLAQVRIMDYLHTSSPRSQRVVAMKLAQSEANVSRQLHLMKTRGLVKITRNKKDARQRDVTLTTKGSSKRKQAEKILQSQYKETMKLVPSSEANLFEKTVNHLLTALNIEAR